MLFDRRWVPAKMYDDGRSLLDKTPRLLFLATVILATFVTSWGIVTFEIFPHAILFNAYKTAKTQSGFLTARKPVFRRLKFVNIVPDDVEAHRFEFVAADALVDPILVPGGVGQFAEYCPGHVGCLAIEYDGGGDVVHAYPYRPEEIEKTTPLVDFPYEQPLGFSMYDAAYVGGVFGYADGDLLAVFHTKYSFPFGQGITRIGRDGRPIWYRRDYSHHDPFVTSSDTALVCSLLIGERPITFNTGTQQVTLPCAEPYLDFVHIVDGEGRLLKEISIIDALLESPYAPILEQADHCDPTHINSVHELNGTVGGGRGIEPGDLVASLRNIDAFAILDRNDHRLKRLVRGSFFKQHKVTHFEGTKFLMFDNKGRDDKHGPSRLLMIDVADGRETTIFPNDTTPEHLRNLFSDTVGGISVSPDRRRVMVTFSRERKAVEVRLKDGAVLTVFNSVHNISHLDSLPEERKTRAASFELRTIHYLERKGRRAYIH